MKAPGEVGDSLRQSVGEESEGGDGGPHVWRTAAARGVRSGRAWGRRAFPMVAVAAVCVWTLHAQRHVHSAGAARSCEPPGFCVSLASNAMEARLRLQPYGFDVVERRTGRSLLCQQATRLQVEGQLRRVT